MSLDWERVRMFDREVAQMFLNMIKQESCARLDLSVIGGFCSKFIRSFKNDHRCLLYLLHSFVLFAVVMYIDIIVFCFAEL